MSAWYVLSALGFYSVDPVSGTYIVGSPLVNRAEVQLGSGKELLIEVRRNDPKHVYVQSFVLNGSEQKRAWFGHSEIAKGGRIELTMGPEPNHNFGSAPNAWPPSLALPGL